MQKMVRVDSAAESIVELLALRIDDQGVVLNSLASGTGPLDSLGTLATGVARVARQAGLDLKGCTELSDKVQEQWEQGKVSLKMSRILGSVGILFLAQLKTTGAAT
jgi:hypothetical protein